MSGGFTVFYQGLMTASDAFAQQATTYESLMPDDGFGCPRGGDDEIDRIMNLLVIGLGNTHSVIANVMEQHGWKLSEAHENYDNNEHDIVAGILKIAYQDGHPLIGDPHSGTGGGTFVPVPKGKQSGRTFTPAPVSVPSSVADTPPSWNDLKYNYFQTLGLGYTGAPLSDPWIGGDLRGMWDLAEKLRTFAYQSGHGEPSGGSIAFDPGTVIDDLNKAVHDLIAESGEPWNGPAAQNFSRAYSQDAARATVVSNAAWTAADTITGLVWELFEWQTELEVLAEPIADHGYRIAFDPDDSDRFQAAATASAQPGWDWRPTRDALRDQYDKYVPLARQARADAARQLNQQYEVVVGILQKYQQENDGRQPYPNLNDDQNAALKNDINSLNALQNSDDYKKAGSSLHLDWVSAGKTALQVAADHGKWADVAGPIVSIILALISA
ncbi:MAG TPA: DUF6317 family protein [Pseudonocardiaceae bacterium]|nr:DUF6317 family protein [Pseudonocardiaceae bacterium]